MARARIWIFILPAAALVGQVPREIDPDLPGLVCRMAMFAQTGVDLPAAGKLARHALDLFAQTDSLESASGAACLTTSAGLMESEGQEQQARQYLERALEIRQALLGPDHFLVADSLVRLGLAHSRLGQLPEAEQMQTRAVQILRQQQPSQELAAALNNLGSVLSAQNRWKEAEPRIREAISIWEQLGGADNPGVAAGLLNLGVLLEERKQYDEAGRVLARARRIDEKAFPANHPRIGMDLNAAGVLAIARKNYQEAEDLLTRSAAILEASQS